MSRRRKENVPKSNILEDEELVLRFQDVALRTAGKLRSKYYEVFEHMTEEDVVSECWMKVIGQGISYDATKGSKFESFVYMVVNCKLVDLTRSLHTLSQVPVSDSLDRVCLEDSESPEMCTLGSIVEDPASQKGFEAIEAANDIEGVLEFISDDVPIREIVEMKSTGYSTSEISRELGIGPSKVGNALTALRYLVNEKFHLGIVQDMGDILNSSRDGDSYLGLMSSMKLVRDRESGVALSDVLRRVSFGWSCREISRDLGCKESSIKNFMLGALGWCA